MVSKNTILTKFDEETYSKVRQIAEAECRSTPSVVRFAVKKYLEVIEIDN